MFYWCFFSESSRKLLASVMVSLSVLHALLWYYQWCTSSVRKNPFFLETTRKEKMKLVFLAPVAWPIAKLLDLVLGSNEHHTYKKAELKSFLQFHRTGQEPLRDDEISILNGVLELNTKNVQTIMTPLKVCLLFFFVPFYSCGCFFYRSWTGYGDFECWCYFGP